MQQPNNSEKGVQLPEKLLRSAEVASFLGVSKMQVYRLVKQGELPAVIFGKSIRFIPSELTNFIERHSTNTHLCVSENSSEPK